MPDAISGCLSLLASFFLVAGGHRETRKKEKKDGENCVTHIHIHTER
jgi:hypothetical protein